MPLYKNNKKHYLMFAGPDTVQQEVNKVYKDTELIFSKDAFDYPLEITTTGANVTVTTDGNDKIYTFKANGSITFNRRTIVDLLVVGAGGSGAANATSPNWGGGGGGGGRVLYATDQSLKGETTYNITVGLGASGANGGDSSIGSLYVAPGGGRGATQLYNGDGGSGGGGGFNGSSTVPPGTNEPSTYKVFKGTINDYGENGGTATATQGGGGGGASQVGGNAPYNVNYGGKGGDGVAVSITGTSVTYGGGGGGGVAGSISGNPANGGAGGGGIGESQSFLGTAGTNYLGGGGGGRVSSGPLAGGHGVVIIRVPNAV